MWRWNDFVQIKQLSSTISRPRPERYLECVLQIKKTSKQVYNIHVSVLYIDRSMTQASTICKNVNHAYIHVTTPLIHCVTPPHHPHPPPHPPPPNHPNHPTPNSLALSHRFVRVLYVGQSGLLFSHAITFKNLPLQIGHGCMITYHIRSWMI